MQRIFPHAFTSTGDINGWTSKDGSVSLAGYAVASAFEGIGTAVEEICEAEVFTPGLICHEYMHTMGLIDLYDQEDVSQAKGIGRWDIMADPYGHDNSGNPGFLSTWSREQVEWMAPEKIEYDGFYTLKPAETSAQAYRIYLFDIPGFSEYFLIENRQKISFDERLWDEGLVIYHVDEAANGMLKRGYPGQEGWPDNGNHYFLAVMQKDGLYDLEQNENSGDAGDMYLPGDVLGPGMEGTVYPNTDGYQGGIIIENGLTIRVDSQQDNGDVVFEVTGFAPAPEGATNQQPPSESSPATETDETTEPSPEATPGPIDQTSEIVPSPATPGPAPTATEDPTPATDEPVGETTPPTTATLATTDPPEGGAPTPVPAPSTAEPAVPDGLPIPATLEPVMPIAPATTIFESNGGPLLGSSGFSIFATRMAWNASLVLAVALAIW